MLLLQLGDLGLPVVPWDVRPGGLGFDLISSLSDGKPVMIGHANGIITIDLAESLDDRREALRVRLGEPYRTILGHLRHEVGHYYQNVLLSDDAAWARCRELFGDERTSYKEALSRHYKLGAPPDWHESFISEYATMEGARALLPVLDDFERALQTDTADKNYARGMELIYQRLKETLDKMGVETLDSVGKPFDPHVHHAIEMTPSSDVPDHTVLTEYQRGYNFRGRLLRAAMVKVAVTPSGSETSEPGPEQAS